MRISFSVSTTTENLETIDKMRGDIPRSKFITRLLENLESKEVKMELKKAMSVVNSSDASNQQTLNVAE
jgi:hypothetical protein